MIVLKLSFRFPPGFWGKDFLAIIFIRCIPTLEINTNKKIAKDPWMTVRTDGQTDGHTDGRTDKHIILALRGLYLQRVWYRLHSLYAGWNHQLTHGNKHIKLVWFEYIGASTPWPAGACAVRNYCLCALIRKNRRGWPGRETDIHISSTGPHYGPLDPSVGINASQRCTPTLEINTNKKIVKGPRTNGRTDVRTDGQTYYTTVYIILRKPWPASACAARNCGPGECLPKSDTDKTAEREKRRRIHGHISLTGPHWDPLDPSVGKMHRDTRTPHWK